MKILKYFSRVTTAGRAFIPQIDGLRFIAIMVVIAFHVRQIVSYHFGVGLDTAAGSGDVVNEVFEAGSLGVQLFFAISGFVLVLPFAKQHVHQAPPVRLRSYFLRRITRLEPPYIIHLGFLILLCGVVYRHLPSHPHLYHNAQWADYALTHIFTSLFYLNGFIFANHPYPNIVLWSLEIEVQFYVLAPLLAGLFKLSGTSTRRAVIIGLILALSLANYAAPHLYVITYSLAGNLQFFLVGFLLCDFYLAGWTDRPARNYKWDLLALSAGVVVVIFHRHPALGILLPWLILGGCSAAFKGSVCSRVLSRAWIATIGGMCYTIYMYHELMISALIRLTAGLQTHIFWLDLIIQFSVMSVAITAMCGVLFVLFERPFMQRGWHTRLWTRLSSRRKPPA